VSQQVDGVLDAACADERPGIDGNPQLSRQLLPVEGGAFTRYLDGAFEESAVHVVGDEPIPKGLQGALRERGFLSSKGVENELPPRVENCVLDGLRIRLTGVGLNDDHHREHRWRHRHLALARCPIHRGKLLLEAIVEDRVASIAGTQRASRCASAD
jgi:hypothetical protein